MSDELYQLVNKSTEAVSFHIRNPLTSVFLLPGLSILVPPDNLSEDAQVLLLQGKLVYSEESIKRPKNVVKDFRVRPLTFDDRGNGPLGFSNAALILCIKDDFALEHIIRRLHAEGILDVWVFTATHYFNGKQTPEEDVAQVRKVCGAAGAVHRVVDASGLKGTPPEVETVIRNRCLRMMHQFQWIWIVDADELWKPGSSLVFCEAIRKHPNLKQLSTEVIPFAGVPAYPIQGNTDVFMIGMRQDQPFINIRTRLPDCVHVPGAYIYHFTGTRRTVQDLVHKNRSSGHYGDRSYNFEKWEKEVLPNIRPGFESGKGGVHMYEDGHVWKGVGSLSEQQLADIPSEIAQYLGDGPNKVKWEPAKISLLAPSRWRATQCVENLKTWLSSATDPSRIEIVISIDSDDETRTDYVEQAKQLPNSQVCIFPNKSMNQALNHAARAATGDVLISVFDDFTPAAGWDQKVLDRLSGCPGKALFVYDTCLAVTVRLQTMGIITRKLFEDWGYFWYGEYLGMFADNDYTERVLLENRQVFALDLSFVHAHFMHGTVKKNPMDRTYEHGNQSWKYDFGKELFDRRRANGFR